MDSDIDSPEPALEQVQEWIDRGEWKSVEDAILRGKAEPVKKVAAKYEEVTRFLNATLQNESRVQRTHDIAREGDLEKLRPHLENRKLVTALGREGRNVLHIASGAGHVHVVEYLLERFADIINSKDRHNREALHHAARLGPNSKVYQLLLQAGGNPEAKDKFGLTPKEYLNSRGSESQLSDMDFGAGYEGEVDFELSDQDNKMIDQWLDKGDVEALEQWVLDGKGHLLQEKDTTNSVSREFMDVLPHYMAKIESIHSAVEDGDLRRTRTLIDLPKLAMARDKKGATPLHNAVLYGQMDTVRYLLQKFPEAVNATDNGGRTALHYAAADKGGGHMIKILQKAGADAFIEDKNGHTPFYYRSHPEQLSLSNLKDEAVIDQLSAGELPRSLLRGIFESMIDLEEDISTWLQAGDVARLEDLVLHGYGDLITGRMADVDDYDVLSFLEVLPQYQNQRTLQAKIKAIHLAVQNGALKEVKSLTDRKKLALSRDSNGATPLHNAVLFQQEEIVKYFVRNYPQAVNARDHCKRTPLHYAAATNDNGKLYKILRKAGADPNLEDCEGHSAKFYLSRPEDLDLRELIAKTDTNLREGISHRVAPNYMEASIQTWLKEGNVGKLEQLVLSGCGDLLEDRESSHPEAQDFLDGLPDYLEKINEIHTAVRAGQTKRVKDLIDRKRLALARDRKGCTPLHNALLYGHTDIVRYLSQSYPNALNAPDYKKRAPIHYAAAARDGGHHFKILDRANADVTLVDVEGHRPEFYLRNPGALNLQSMRDRDRDFFPATTFDEEHRPASGGSEASAGSSSTNFSNRSGVGMNRRTNLSRLNEAVTHASASEDDSTAALNGLSLGPGYNFQPTTPVGQYLANTLGPVLTKALAEIVISRPEDPIDYLSQYLHKYNGTDKKVSTYVLYSRQSEYQANTLGPVLTKALAEIVISRPEDPIDYLSQYLHKYNGTDKKVSTYVLYSRQSEYLANTLGPVLTKALAEIVISRPEDPIDYLSQYLHKYNGTDKKVSTYVLYSRQSEYLANTLGPVLTKALAEIVISRPEDPIDYLSQYLHKYNGTDKKVSTYVLYSRQSEYQANTLGPVLTKALAEIVISRPEDPIDYLSQYLHKYNGTDKKVSTYVLYSRQSEYLANTLGPVLTKALAEIVISRPEDPIDYLSQYLHKYNGTDKKSEENPEAATAVQ